MALSELQQRMASVIIAELESEYPGLTFRAVDKGLAPVRELHEAQEAQDRQPKPREFGAEDEAA